jgi:hypothetical protein
MKKITLFATLLAVSSIISVYAGEIAIDQTQSLKTTIMTAPEGSVIVLTDDAGIYPCATIDGQAMAANNITIKAAPGLTTKPTIQFVSGTDNASFFFMRDGGSLTMEGVILDGSHTTYFIFISQYTNLSSITLNDCDFINCTNQAGTAGAIVVAKKGTTSNWTVPVGKVNVTNCRFYDVPNGIFLATSASYADVTFSNCLVKGNSTTEAFTNTTTKPNTYIFDHITMDGRNFRELSVTANTSIKYTNLIFANNNYVAKSLLPGTITSQAKLAFFNYVPGRNVLAAFVDGIDPKFGVKHIATATEYVNKGTDGKTIGYYGDGLPDTAPSALKNVIAPSLSIYPTVLSGNDVIKVSDVSDAASFKVQSATGATVISGKLANGSIKLNNLSNGFYFVKVNNAVAKFVIR